MPLTGRGMLMTSMDVDPNHEAELNLWYDREHIAERVAIDGFLEARRYVAVDAAPKYLCLYSTETFAVLSSPAYRAALGNQTDWSRTNISRFRNMGRAVARITASRGGGRGSALGLVRLRPGPGAGEGARHAIAARLDPGDLAGILSMHLLESDAGLSTSLTEPDAENPGAADWYVLVDGSEAEAVSDVVESRFGHGLGSDLAIVSTGRYRLLWDLARAEL